MDIKVIPSAGMPNGLPCGDESFLSTGANATDRPSTAEQTHRPSTAMSISDFNELGQESMTFFLRTHMTGILQPVADNLDGVHDNLDSITGDIHELSGKAESHKALLNEHRVLIDGLRTDLGATMEQLKATKLLLEKTIADKNALKASHRTSQEDIRNLQNEAASIRMSMKEMRSNVQDSCSNLDEKSQAADAKLHQNIEEVRVSLVQLDHRHKKTSDVLQFNQLSFDTHFAEVAPLPRQLKSLHTKLEQLNMDSLSRCRNLAQENASMQKMVQQYKEATEQGMDDRVRPLLLRVESYDGFKKDTQQRLQSMDAALAEHSHNAVENGENFNRLMRHMEKRHTTDSHEIRRWLENVECDLKDTSKRIQKDHEDSHSRLMEEIEYGSKRSARLEKALGIDELSKDAQEQNAGLQLTGGILLSDAQIEQIKEAFTRFDADGSGSISTEEVVEVLKSLGHEPTEDVLQMILKDLDPDHSGDSSFEEFCTLMSKMVGPDGHFNIESYLENVSADAAREAKQNKIVELVPVLQQQIKSSQEAIEAEQMKLKGNVSRVESLEGDHAELVKEVLQLRKGLELSQEYWKGFSRGLKETKKVVRQEEESELSPNRLRLRVLPPLAQQVAIS